MTIFAVVILIGALLLLGSLTRKGKPVQHTMAPPTSMGRKGSKYSTSC